VRFTIEFLRDDPRGNLFGLTDLTGLSTSQIISLIVAAGSVLFMIVRLRNVNRKETDAENL
jgi:prolipoprotein diacylglyceryltransferase